MKNRPLAPRARNRQINEANTVLPLPENSAPAKTPSKPSPTSLNDSTNLLRLISNDSKTDDGYRVIDPRTVAGHVSRICPQGRNGSRTLIKEHFALWADLGAAVAAYGCPHLVEYAGRTDHRATNRTSGSGTRLWVENPYFDHVKQWYLLWSRFFEASVITSKGLDPHTQKKTQFYTRQFVNAVVTHQFRCDQSGGAQGHIE